MASGVGQSQQNFQMMLQGINSFRDQMNELRRRAEVNYASATKQLQDEVNSGYHKSWKEYLTVEGNREAFKKITSAMMGGEQADALIQGLSSGLLSAEELQNMGTKAIANMVVAPEQDQTQSAPSGSAGQQAGGGVGINLPPYQQGQGAPGATGAVQGSAPLPTGASPRNLAGQGDNGTVLTRPAPFAPSMANPNGFRAPTPTPQAMFVPQEPTSTVVNDQTVTPPVPSATPDAKGITSPTIDTSGSNIDQVAVSVDTQLGQVFGFDPGAMPNQRIDKSVSVVNGKPTFNTQVYDHAHGAGAAQKLQAQLQAKGSSIDQLVQTRFNALEAAQRGDKSYPLGGGPASSGAASSPVGSGFDEFRKQLFGSAEAAAIVSTPVTEMTGKENIIAGRALTQGWKWAVNQDRKNAKAVQGEFANVPDEVMLNMVNNAQTGPRPQDNSIAGSVYSGLTPAQQTQFMEATRQYESSLKRTDANLYLQSQQLNAEEQWRLAQMKATVAKSAATANPYFKEILDSSDKIINDFMTATYKKEPDPAMAQKILEVEMAKNPQGAVASAWNARTAILVSMSPENVRAQVRTVTEDLSWWRGQKDVGDVVMPTVTFPGIETKTQSDKAAEQYRQKYRQNSGG